MCYLQKSGSDAVGFHATFHSCTCRDSAQATAASQECFAQNCADNFDWTSGEESVAPEDEPNSSSAGKKRQKVKAQSAEPISTKKPRREEKEGEGKDDEMQDEPVKSGKAGKAELKYKDGSVLTREDAVTLRPEGRRPAVSTLFLFFTTTKYNLRVTFECGFTLDSKHYLLARMKHVTKPKEHLTSQNHKVFGFWVPFWLPLAFICGIISIL